MCRPAHEPGAEAPACVRAQLANTRSFYDLLLRCCLSKVGWFRETRRFAPTLLILRRAVLSAFYPVFKEPGLAFPVRFAPLTVARTVVSGTLQSYDGRDVSVNPRPAFPGSAPVELQPQPMTKPSACSALHSTTACRDVMWPCFRRDAFQCPGPPILRVRPERVNRSARRAVRIPAGRRNPAARDATHMFFYCVITHV